MNSSAIEEILQSDPQTSRIFQGFSTPDVQLPSIKRFPALFILNTDTSDGPGIHWCLAVILKNGVCEFFDPLGKRPDVYNFDRSLFQKCSKIKFNVYAVQAQDSVTCGHHCLFFAFHRARGTSPTRIMKKYYRKSTRANDLMVYSFVKNYFGARFAKISLPLVSF